MNNDRRKEERKKEGGGAFQKKKNMCGTSARGFLCISRARAHSLSPTLASS